MDFAFVYIEETGGIDTEANAIVFHFYRISSKVY